MHREVTAELGAQHCQATKSELFHHLGPRRGDYPRISPTDSSWEVLSTTSPSPPWCLGRTQISHVLKKPAMSLQSRKEAGWDVASWCGRSWEQQALLPITDPSPSVQLLGHRVSRTHRCDWTCAPRSCSLFPCSPPLLSRFLSSCLVLPSTPLASSGGLLRTRLSVSSEPGA